MEEKIKELKELIDKSNKIVVFTGAGVQKVVYQILEVKMDYIIKNMTIHQN